MSIKQSVKALTDPPATTASLAPAPAVGAKPGGVSVGRSAATASGGGGAQDELDYTQREYWPDKYLHSVDGVITVVERPIKSILLVDASRRQYKEPT